MIIRRAQFEPYVEPTNPVWIRTTAVELRSHLPPQCQSFQDRDLDELIAQARQDARGAGFNTSDAIPFFAELRLILGAGWRQDPILSPLRSALEESSDPDEEERLQDWYETIDDYMDSTFGENDIFFNEAVSRLTGPLSSNVRDDLEHFYRERWCYAEWLDREAFLEKTAQAVARYQLNEGARGIYVRLNLLLGIAFDENPVFRPLAELLRRDRSGAELSEKAPGWVRTWWESFPPEELE